MYKACKTEQSAERQQHIEDCMAKLMRTHTYQSISVCALCESAGVPRKTFYRYFETKDDVFYAIADHNMQKYESFLGPYSEGDRRTSVKDIEKIFTYWAQNSELLSAIRRSGMTGPFLERLLTLSKQEKQGYSTTTHPNSAQKVNLSNTFVVIGIFALILDWHASGCQPPPKEMAEVVIDLITKPLYIRLE